MPASATYLYAVVHRAVRPVLTRVPRGLPGATAPRIVDLDGALWIVCAEVPLNAYDGRQIEEGLSDLAWVSRIAVAHAAVVERFTRLGGATVIPMKLFTMFSSEERARDEMRRRKRDLEGILKRIKGCQEWGVRVTRSVARASDPPASKTPASGAAFLAAKKQARDAVRARMQKASHVADEVYRALGNAARDSVRRDPVEGATSPPMLDAVFLVPIVRRARFKLAAAKAAATCKAAGAVLVLTGPWPAYHFVQAGEVSA